MAVGGDGEDGTYVGHSIAIFNECGFLAKLNGNFFQMGSQVKKKMKEKNNNFFFRENAVSFLFLRTSKRVFLPILKGHKSQTIL